MVIALPLEALAEKDNDAFWLEDEWSQLKADESFDCSPSVYVEDDDFEYANALRPLGREGVLSVVREILAERGEG